MTLTQVSRDGLRQVSGCTRVTKDGEYGVEGRARGNE